MVSLIALAVISEVNTQNPAQVWQDTRTLCADKDFVYVHIKGGGKGVIFHDEICYAAKDSRYMLYKRTERAASHYGGSTRYPLVQVVNKVDFYNGRLWTKFDALTGELQTEKEGRSLYDLYPALMMFWLDLRSQKGYQVTSVKDRTHRLTGSEVNYRVFTLESPKEEAKWFIEVRLSDGYVTYDWHNYLGGSAGERGVYEGWYMDREPRELDWKPPNITKRDGSG